MLVLQKMAIWVADARNQRVIKRRGAASASTDGGGEQGGGQDEANPSGGLVHEKWQGVKTSGNRKNSKMGREEACARHAKVKRKRTTRNCP